MSGTFSATRTGSTQQGLGQIGRQMLGFGRQQEGQVHPKHLQEDWHEKNPCFLQRESSTWPKDRLDYA
ncbi:hypothetical protein Pyn_12922 [Prunus yedoensis var. nudiflora]|uniref:Uncharacterized protein n=1 Tax=Prunus yedoensis var. nudiflora TaxID=2094558 RepID=A0A314ZG68_PRUYE|nr:hypothetical protein Pyn_12922 [Prunus yedoensis var. nudiflora]